LLCALAVANAVHLLLALLIWPPLIEDADVRQPFNVGIGVAVAVGALIFDLPLLGSRDRRRGRGK
jgi:hypothetical protein